MSVDAAFRGRRVLIVGTGREGQAVASLAEPIAASVVAYTDDDSGVAAWREAWGELVPVHVRAVEGGFDLVVVSPGVSPRHPLLQRVREAGIPVTTGTSLWLGEHARETVAVTGSKGKSTTSSLIHHLEQALHGPAVLGGNIGVPLLAMPESPRYVVELSSYQCAGLAVSPDTAVLTSLFPEHLDWHGSEQAYYRDKLNLVAHRPRRVIVNATDGRLLAELTTRQPMLAPELVGLDESFHVADGWFMKGRERLFERDRLPLKGEHNAINACLALAAIDRDGLDIVGARGEIARALAGFAPLEHRLEEIPDASGLTFVDDSLSTSPYAAIEAMRAFAGAPLTLLVGGADRGVDYSPLAEHLAKHPIAAVVGLPGSGEKLARLMPSGQHTVVASDMREAVGLARELTPQGGVVLLSPAAPSYGIYRNFAERAADFRSAIAATGENSD
ncbi:UDP-N-acetylmuramoyl-L-alanine--D-glutamate ligase [Salinibacterium sp. SYSU T00001]|uniref:UDP-N-acetylmuramoyl-L-alanine--D-glutamate ligase n=1 Tax=Homoserinimonas sedimenticola TaxID=2986805 RepID=UPI002236B179|nr:UDP-N-acetylmuramoyl-L-alanine--D-glutamate ligase [Salinibacterium sedimenticola]MCW4386572.1 UDP-N-acetylmuramoyl-L-alanine--D-glutamate ligase [Salinibacterium sedimenticola]